MGLIFLPFNINSSNGPFSSNHIDLYVYGVKIGKIEYEKVIDKSFSMSNVQKGKLTDTFIFEEMIENVFLEVEGNQKIVSFFSNAISIVIYYLVVLVTVFIFSYYRLFNASVLIE